jgi:Uma2 family endonuclease
VSELGDSHVTIHRLSVAQYRAMAAAGILGPDDRTELLEGLLVDKRTKHPPHRIATRCAREALAAVVPTGWYVDSQEPIGTIDSEPEPDIAVIRGTTKDYRDENPPASQVGLVVEVSDVTLGRDRVTKARIYARAAIPIYWIVDVGARQLEVYTRPTGPSDAPGYAERRVLTATDRVAVVLDGAEVGTIGVVDLLP